MSGHPVDPDQVAMTMLAMAETLRVQNPPKYKMAIKCARGAHKLARTNEMIAHTTYQLSKLLFFYASNLEEARQMLEKAYELLAHLADYFLIPRLECLTLICEAYIHGPHTATTAQRVSSLLRNELNAAKPFPAIYNKLLLYYIEVNTMEGSIDQSIAGCDMGVQSTTEISMQLYFRVTKKMVTARLQNTMALDTSEESNVLRTLIDQLDTNTSTYKNLKHFIFCTQLAYYISEGKFQASKKLLRDMQTEVTALTKDNTHLFFGMRWSDTLPMTVFVCLMTTISAVMKMNYDRAQKYYLVGMRHISEYFGKAARGPCEYGIVRSMQRMRVALNEIMTHCNIMACKPNHAMRNIQDMIQYSGRTGVVLTRELLPCIQSLLGLYCIYLRHYDLAVKHFDAALKNRGRCDKNVYVMIKVNLGLLYLCQGDFSNFYSTTEALTTSNLTGCSSLVLANSRFLTVFLSYLTNKVTELRRISADVLDTTRTEELSRLHTIVVTLLTVSCPDQNNFQFFHSSFETIMKSPTNDHSLLYWINRIMSRIKSNNKADSTANDEIVAREEAFLVPEMLRAEHEKSQAPTLIHWFEGDPSPFLPKDE